jgi:hypothetical protein
LTSVFFRCDNILTKDRCKSLFRKLWELRVFFLALCRINSEVIALQALNLLKSLNKNQHIIFGTAGMRSKNACMTVPEV